MDTTFPTTISASRVPAVLGLDKRVSPLTLFLRLRGVIQERDLEHDEAVREGRFYERATAEIICAKYNMKLVDGFEQREMVSGCLSGHPDFLAIDETGKLVILEVKNPFWSYSGGESDDDWGEPGTDEVPRAYLIQSMVYCHLFRKWVGIATAGGEFTVYPDAEPADYAYVVVKLRGGVERYKVPYNPRVIAAVEAEVQEMLRRVRENDPPDARDEPDMRKRWIGDPKATTTLDARMLNTLAEIVKVKAQIKELEAHESALKMEVFGTLRENSTGTYNDVVVVTAKPSRGFNAERFWADNSAWAIANGYVTVDTTRLRNEQKALYEQFMEAKEAMGEQKRTLLIKDRAIKQIMESIQ